MAQISFENCYSVRGAEGQICNPNQWRCRVWGGEWRDALYARPTKTLPTPRLQKGREKQRRAESYRNPRSIISVKERLDTSPLHCICHSIRSSTTSVPDPAQLAMTRFHMHNQLSIFLATMYTLETGGH